MATVPENKAQGWGRADTAVMYGEHGNPVASAHLSYPAQHRFQGEWVSSMEEPGSAQRFWDGPGFRPSRPKVSWAGVSEGAPATAAHELIAMMSHRSGITPYTDTSLSEAGARMSRSAVRRGLVIPNPRNPRMVPNIVRFPKEEVQSATNASDSDITRINKLTPELVHHFTPNERHNARSLLRARREPQPGPQGEQQSLFK